MSELKPLSLELLDDMIEQVGDTNFQVMDKAFRQAYCIAVDNGYTGVVELLKDYSTSTSTGE